MNECLGLSDKILDDYLEETQKKHYFIIVIAI